jgi:type I site-specific restriction-modification system R (restriction) subunit
VGGLEVLVGDEQRLRLIAEDLVEHFDRRLEAMDGKAMVVCMSRRICVDCTTRSSSCVPSGIATTTPWAR